MTAVDLDELAACVGRSVAMFSPRISLPNGTVSALITELRALRASAAEGQREWVKCSERLPEEGRMVLMWDSDWNSTYEPECLRRAVAPNLSQLWIDSAGNKYTDLDMRVHSWRHFPSPPEKVSTCTE